MKIGILCAGDDELAPFLPQIKEMKMTEKAMLRFYEGKLGGADVVALYSGVCKVNAAIATQILIDTFGVSTVINAGTAGAIDEKLNLFDTVVATDCCYLDVADDILTDFHPWMKTVFFESAPYLLEKAKLAVKKAELSNVFFGRMVTGEAFITDEGREQITRKFAPLSVDMETAAVAHVCYQVTTAFFRLNDSPSDAPVYSSTGLNPVFRPTLRALFSFAIHNNFFAVIECVFPDSLHGKRNPHFG